MANKIANGQLFFFTPMSGVMGPYLELVFVER